MITDFDRLERTLVRALWLCGGAVAILLAVTGASLWSAIASGRALRDAAARLPVVVVPNAVAGIYTPGLAEEALRGIARYVVGLATNFSGRRGFEDRFDELESFASPHYLPQMQSARRSLRREVESQNQSRSFVADAGTETLAQVAPGLFEYTTRGERAVFASGLPIDTWQSTVRLRLRVASPSAANRTGVQVEQFDLSDAAPAMKAAALSR